MNRAIQVTCCHCGKLYHVWDDENGEVFCRCGAYGVIGGYDIFCLYDAIDALYSPEELNFICDDDPAEMLPILLDVKYQSYGDYVNSIWAKRKLLDDEEISKRLNKVNDMYEHMPQHIKFIASVDA